MIHQLWKELSEFILLNTGIPLSIEKSDIMLNEPEASCILEEKIIAFPKHYIYVTKCNKYKPKSSNLEQYLENVSKLQKYLCRNTKSIDKFSHPWEYLFIT